MPPPSCPCRRQGASLSAERRRALYSLFLQYEERKGQYNDWDMADMTAYVFRCLDAADGDRLPTRALFNFIYVDEVGR